jgi:zinc protease
MKPRLLSVVVWLLALSLLVRAARAADKIEFTQEMLPNGLRVIYAPLHQAPVVHVRVLYHVGSRDERPDRQGFAHMFEHMMFRGSEHVKPEEHMKLVQMVGGMSNAFTSFDQTVYVNTIPANQLEMTLYLEADRMASFKVNENIFKTERNVVAEEWRRGQNQPYGTMYQDFLAMAFKNHPYHWSPIGNMQQLAQAQVSELQDFFNTYYIPNNAVLVIAGDIDVAAAKGMVGKYFGWIPKGADIKRNIPTEPVQEQMREEVTPRQVPMTRIMIGYHAPAYKSDDNYALSLLGDILGSGASSRLHRMLVSSENPTCLGVSAGDQTLEDGGFFIVQATVMQGKDPDEVERALYSAVAQVVEKGVTNGELDKAKLEERIALVNNRETATNVAAALGEEELFGGDANRVNTALEKINAVTTMEIQAVARIYLAKNKSTMLRVKPDPLGKEQRAATTQNPPAPAAPPPVAQAREVKFPEGYPAKPPIADARLKASFAKGTESVVNGVKVIVMPDSRLPIVSWGLTMRTGSNVDPAGKEGLASMTADMARRGSGGLTYDELNEDLESKGIHIGISDADDFTRLSASCLTQELDHAMQRSREVLLQPTFDAKEFDKLKAQMMGSLTMSQARPDTVAGQQLAKALFGNSPLGTYATPNSVAAITLDDVKAFYKKLYKPTDAIFLIAGDVTVERGQALAAKLLEGWPSEPLPRVEYNLPAPQSKLRIILVARPEGKQAMIRMAARAYDVHDDAEKFAGSLIGGILSSGIESRLGRYVRAEKGLVYSVNGSFFPDRHAGEFRGGAETKVETAGETIEAMFKVFGDLAKDGATETELKEAQLRTVGRLVMEMQTIQQQATYRQNGLLNGYPVDYYDRYPERISGVPLAKIAEVTAKYVRPNALTVMVVAPKEAVLAQLQKLGEVEVVAMPGKGEEMLRPKGGEK